MYQFNLSQDLPHNRSSLKWIPLQMKQYVRVRTDDWARCHIGKESSEVKQCKNWNCVKVYAIVSVKNRDITYLIWYLIMIYFTVHTRIIYFKNKTQLTPSLCYYFASLLTGTLSHFDSNMLVAADTFKFSMKYPI